MKIFAKNITYCFFATLMLATVGIVLRTYALFTCFDRDIGYYATDAVLPDVFHILCVGVCIFALAFVLVLPKSKNYDYKVCFSVCTFGKVGAIFALVGTATYALYSLITLSDDVPTSFGPVVKSSVVNAVSLFVSIFGILAFIYFLIVLLGRTEKNDNYTLFGYCYILFVLMILAKSYFDFFTTMNSPNKLLTQTTLMLCMLYMLCELRFSLKNSVPRLYSGVSLAVIYFAFVSSVPGIIAFGGGVLNKVEYLLCDFVLLTFAVYVCARLVEFALAQKEI